MTRLTRIVLMFGSAFGFAAAAPANSEAGVIPWVYNAIFGPVGSLRAGYTPMYANYSSGYAYSGNAPMSVAYSPAVSSYGGGGCSSCGQSAYYAPMGGYDTYYGGYAQSYYGSSGCSSCGGNCSSCSSGNCSNGSCSNCSPSSSNYSSSSGYSPSPIPDPGLNNYNSTSSDVLQQLRSLREEMRELKHQQAEDEKYIKEQHPTYRRQPYRPETYNNDRSEPVYPRGNTRNDTYQSRPSDRDYTPPRRSGAPTTDPLEEESRRPVLTAPDTEKSTAPNGDSSKVKETEPQTLRLDSRITTRAVAPRDRKQIESKSTKSVIANSNKAPVKTTSDSLRLTDLARH